MTSFPLLLGLAGCAVALLSFAAVLMLVLGSHPGTRQAYYLIAALVASLFWAGSSVYGLWVTQSPLVWFPIIEALHLFPWILFTASVLRGVENSAAARRISVATVVLGLICVAVVIALSRGFAIDNIELASRIELLALMFLSLIGLLAIEQVMRNSQFSGRRIVRPLSVGVGLIFVLDIFCYSQAFIFSEVNAWTWQLRGWGNAIGAPFVLIAIKRQRDWEHDLFVSRQMVFHTATLVAAGLYLMALGIASSLLRPFEATPRAILEIAFLAAAGLVFVYALFSTAVHRRFRVFIAKHFYRNRYDYRQEWLRLIETLAGGANDSSIGQRGVKALAEIVESPGGELWWADELGQPFENVASWGRTLTPAGEKHAQADVTKFLAETHWVIDTEEYVINPELYANAFEAAPAVLEPPSLYVPLILDEDLRGFVRLARRADLDLLGFEDHDLLKTTGKQVAVFLAQERVQAKLAETKQFEAFSRLTTFLMHDLKNLISQQELVVGNARRFRQKPEFIDDAMKTVESSVQRMKKVLERLQSHVKDDRSSTVCINTVVQEVANACVDREPRPQISEGENKAYVAINKDRLAMVLTHAIRNAQDATGADGSITLQISAVDGWVQIDVVDTGVGMSEEFIRDRLFRPFDSTKGAQGMGIGAYQIRETLRAAGGDVELQSAEGRGTTVSMRLPLISVRQGGEAPAP